jgi:hypothetical protein
MRDRRGQTYYKNTAVVGTSVVPGTRVVLNLVDLRRLYHVLNLVQKTLVQPSMAMTSTLLLAVVAATATILSPSP